MSAEAAAKAFGDREAVESISLSPDGKKVAFIAPGPDRMTIAMVADVASGESHAVFTLGKATAGRVQYCGWSAPDRLVCSEFATIDNAGLKMGVRRLFGVDATGGNVKSLAQRNMGVALRGSQDDGGVIDWLAGDTGQVLMARDHVPEQTTGSHLASTGDGLGVDEVDTRTLRSRPVEAAHRSAAGYISDSQGAVRIMALVSQDSQTGRLKGLTTYLYRQQGKREWQPFSRVSEDEKTGLRPLAIDPKLNAAYALQKLNGRDALYRVALDGSLKAELAFSNPHVDVDDVVTIGRHGRVIGATFVTDRRETEYFDPEYRALAKSLSRAIPGLPLVRFAGASADEQTLLIFAGSDVDPGHYYLYTRADRHLAELFLVRPGLEKAALSPVKSVTYRTADGIDIPAYLTMPPGGAKPIAALVMPHGGPASRDEWGFDWLAQYFAQRGYAVLQPNFRGSSGYGDKWFADNGFKSWRLAIGDVVAGGKWLVAQGIAAPDKLAIFGWSYGGYAALQSNVVDPDLFKAVVAVAPVTDLDLLKTEARAFTNSALVANYVGLGPQVSEGSPARHADRFKAPVLLFQGDMDLNVDAQQSRAMDAALRKAGKQTHLVMYPGLDHQLASGTARRDMLSQSDAFLRQALKL